MCKRIYKSYKIRVINCDGEKYIKLNGNIDTMSYGTMIKYYHTTKDKYKDEDCTVEMVGVYEDGKVGNALYSKTFLKEVNNDKELLKPTDEVVSEIKELLELLDRKSKYHRNMKSALDKKQDLLLHKIETLRSLDTTKEGLINEKLKIIDELEEIRHNRRFNKNEESKLQVVYSKIKMQEVVESFSQIKIPIDTKDYKYIQGELENKLVKEISYANDKQRINLMGQLKHKYKKIINDEVRNTLICYNNSN